MELKLQVTEKQLSFIEARETEVLFGGAAGGGKSYGQTVDGAEVTTHSGVRIMSVGSGTTVAIDGIQFQNAYSTANGAAISNSGTVTVSNSVFNRNTVSGSSSQ